MAAHDGDVTEPETDAESTPIGIRAYLAGAGAALIGGIVWAVIVRLTEFEIGYVAIGVGFLVGLAMTRTTEARGRQPAIQAAGLAAIGLLFAKMLIVQWVTLPLLSDHLRNDADAPGIGAVWEMRASSTFPADIQGELNALGERDTVPDVLWAAMLEAGKARAVEASAPERAELAEAYAAGVRLQLGIWQLLWWQVSAFDLLWLLLALSTAYRMMATPAGDQEGSEVERSPPAATA